MGRGIGGVGSLVQGLDYHNRMQQQAKQDALELETKSHLKGFQELGEDYTPGDDYDVEAYHLAQIDYAAELMKKDDVAKMIYEKRKRDLDFQHESIKELGNQAEGLLSMGNTDEALKRYEAAYESFADGSDMEIQGNTLIFHNMDGSTEEKTYKSRDEMVQAMRGMVQSVMTKEKFGQTAMAARQGINIHNANQLTKPTVLRNPKTGKLVRMFDKLRDPATGQPLNKELRGYRITDGTFYLDDKGNPITEEQVMQGNYVDLDTGKTLANIKKLEAEAVKARTSGAKEAMSPEEKFAHGLMRAYGLNQVEAMDKVLELKKQSTDAKTLLALIKDNFGDIDEDLKKTISEIAPGYFSNKPMSQKIAEERAAEKKPGKGVGANTPPMKGARQAKDGKWYIKKNGKWYLIEE